MIIPRLHGPCAACYNSVGSISQVPAFVLGRKLEGATDPQIPCLPVFFLLASKLPWPKGDSAYFPWVISPLCFFFLMSCINLYTNPSALLDHICRHNPLLWFTVQCLKIFFSLVVIPYSLCHADCWAIGLTRAPSLPFSATGRSCRKLGPRTQITYKSVFKD